MKLVIEDKKELDNWGNTLYCKAVLKSFPITDFVYSIVGYYGVCYVAKTHFYEVIITTKVWKELW